MFIKKKKNRSGTISVVVAEKLKGNYKELVTIGIARSEEEADALVRQGHEWTDREKHRRHPRLDLYGEERAVSEREKEDAERVLSNISNILLNGSDLILDRIFDRVGFNRIDDEVFRKLVKARLSYPASKAATVEYLKNHFDDDVDLSRIYRYLDKLNDRCCLLQNSALSHLPQKLSNLGVNCHCMSLDSFAMKVILFKFVNKIN